MGGLCLSFGGAIVRLVSDTTNSWQFLTWRSLAFFALMMAIAAYRNGSIANAVRATTGNRRLIVPIALAVSLGQICYVLALIHTSVASALFILGSAPLVMAVAAWLLLGERVSAKGAAVLALAMGGIALMFAGGDSGALAGKIYALGALCAYVAYVMLMRYARGVDTFAASAVGGLLGAAITGMLAGGMLVIAWPDFGLAVLSGTVQVGGGFAFITLAAKRITATETTLLVLLEAILGPIFVWALFGETPATNVLIGGVIVVMCVIAFALLPARASSADTSR